MSYKYKCHIVLLPLVHFSAIIIISAIMGQYCMMRVVDLLLFFGFSNV